jgi:hypothetical protein
MIGMGSITAEAARAEQNKKKKPGSFEWNDFSREDFS